MSKYKTPENRAGLAKIVDLTTLLREKRWNISNAAAYLGVSRQRLYAVFADPRRIRLWECAVDGMPVCTAAIAGALRKERKSRQPVAREHSADRASKPQLEVEENDVVVSTRHVGDIAVEGDEGWIAEVRIRGRTVDLHVCMPRGSDWFSLADFHRLFITNGRTRRV